MFNGDLITVLSTVVSSVATAIVTYKVATTNAGRDRALKREDFMDSQMRLLMETYQKEVAGLRTDITSLQAENTLLRDEIISLKSKIIEMEDIKNDK